MKQSKLEKIIEQARCNRSTHLDLSYKNIEILPESIGNLESLTYLDLNGNQLNSLPESIGNLANLRSLNLNGNQLSSLPESIGNLASLIYLDLGFNQLVYLPNSLANIISLKALDLNDNELAILLDAICKLTDLESLNLNNNQLKILPEGIIYLTTLHELDLNNNPLTDLSILNNVNILDCVWFLNVELPRRYWTKFSDWKSEWLLDEDNAEIRRILIEQVGYEKICEELNAIDIDTWREYTLMIIDGVEVEYDEENDELIDIEPMVLLKMTFPSTQHIHILRVPPEMTSAEAAITWVNHGIHPDEFAVQT